MADTNGIYTNYENEVESAFGGASIANMQREFTRERVSFGAQDVKPFMCIKGVTKDQDNVDNTAYALIVPLAGCTGITYTVTTETYVQRALGTGDDTAFLSATRGIPAVSGSMVLSVYDEHPVLGYIWRSALKSAGAIRAAYWGTSAAFSDITAQGSAGVGWDVFQQGVGLMTAMAKANLFLTLLYMSQLPPVDIILTFADKRGNAAIAKFESVYFINEAGSISVDNQREDLACNFICRRYLPKTPWNMIHQRELKMGMLAMAYNEQVQQYNNMLTDRSMLTSASGETFSGFTNSSSLPTAKALL